MVIDLASCRSLVPRHLGRNSRGRPLSLSNQARLRANFSSLASSSCATLRNEKPLDSAYKRSSAFIIHTEAYSPPGLPSILDDVSPQERQHHRKDGSATDRQVASVQQCFDTASEAIIGEQTVEVSLNEVKVSLNEVKGGDVELCQAWQYPACTALLLMAAVRNGRSREDAIACRPNDNSRASTSKMFAQSSSVTPARLQASLTKSRSTCHLLAGETCSSDVSGLDAVLLDAACPMPVAPVNHCLRIITVPCRDRGGT